MTTKIDSMQKIDESEKIDVKPKNRTTKQKNDAIDQMLNRIKDIPIDNFEEISKPKVVKRSTNLKNITNLFNTSDGIISYDTDNNLVDRHLYFNINTDFKSKYKFLSDKDLFTFLFKHEKATITDDIDALIRSECFRRDIEKIYLDFTEKRFKYVKHITKNGTKADENLELYDRLCKAASNYALTFPSTAYSEEPNNLTYRSLDSEGIQKVATKKFNMPQNWTKLTESIKPSSFQNTLMAVCGKVNDFFVVDLDIAHYDFRHFKKESECTGCLNDRKPSIATSHSGIELLKQLEEKYGKLPKTRTVQTPSGGKHLYFKYNPLVRSYNGIKKIYERETFITTKNKKDKVQQIKTGTEIVNEHYGIDIKSEYSNIVLPPSYSPIYKKEYTIIDNSGLAEVPKWFLEIIINGKIDGDFKPIKKVNAPYKDEFRYPDGTYDEQFIQKLVNILPNNAFEHSSEWRKLGSAIKGCGCPFTMFHDFSIATPNYKGIKDCQKAWDSFDIVNYTRRLKTIKELCYEYCDKKIVDDVFNNSVRQPLYRPFTKTPCWKDESILEKYEKGVTEKHLEELHNNFFVYNGSGKPTIYFYEIEGTKSKFLALKRTALGNMKNTFADRTVSFPHTDQKKLAKLANTSYNEHPEFKKRAKILAQELDKDFKANNYSKEEKKEKGHEFELKIAYLQREFRIKEATSDKPAPLWHRKLIKEVFMVTCDPTKDVLFKDKYDQSLCLNMYQKPAHSMESVKKWIKANGNSQDEQIAHQWLKNHLFHVVSNGNQTTYEWHLHYFGNVLYNRGFKSAKWPMWIGTQGVGKSCVVDKLFREYFGQALGYIDSSDFASNGALSPLIGKTFAFLDELKIERREDLQKLKTLVTAKEITYESKGIDPINVPNFLTGILVSDQEIPFRSNEDQRRFLECRLNPNFINGDVDELTGLSSQEIEQRKRKYFDPLYNNKWQYFCSMFYEFDPNYNFTTHRTEANDVTSDRLMNVFDRWLQVDIIPRYNEYTPFCVSKDLFEKYKLFYSEYLGMACKKQQAAFNKQMLDNGVSLQAPTRKRINGIQSTCFELSDRTKIINLWCTRTKLSLNDVLVDDCICKQASGIIHCDTCDTNLCKKCQHEHDNKHSKDLEHLSNFVELECCSKKKNNYS